VTYAAGGIVRGHVLVSPQAHINAAQSLDVARKSDFVAMLLKTYQRLEALGDSVTAFEHSAPNNDTSLRSACIDHAHTQVFPGAYDLSKATGADPIKYASLEDFYAQPSPYDGYLMHTNPDGSVTATRDVGRPQHFRRLIFETIGRPEEWDYAVFPREDITEGTIALFES